MPLSQLIQDEGSVLYNSGILGGGVFILSEMASWTCL